MSIKKSATKKPIALEAAQELIKAEQQKLIETAREDLDKIIGEWSIKHNCALVVIGQFKGNQIMTEIEVVKK